MPDRTHPMLRWRLIALLTVLALVIAACGDDSSSEPESQDEPAPEETDEEPTAESDDSGDPATEAAAALPETPVIASLAQAGDFSGAAPDPADLPVQPGDVEAHWYRAGTTYAVVYVGLDASTDACPGNSMQLPTGAFDFVSNAELPGAACPDFPTRIENSDSQGVKVCDGVVSYLTLIPTDQTGVLFAGVEAPGDAPGTGTGVYSQAPIADPNQAPEIDPAGLAC